MNEYKLFSTPLSFVQSVLWYCCLSFLRRLSCPPFPRHKTPKRRVQARDRVAEEVRTCSHPPLANPPTHRRPHPGLPCAPPTRPRGHQVVGVSFRLLPIVTLRGHTWSAISSLCHLRLLTEIPHRWVMVAGVMVVVVVKWRPYQW